LRLLQLQGANKQGIKEHLKVKKKQDALGVGAVSRSSSTDVHGNKQRQHATQPATAAKRHMCGELRACTLLCVLLVAALLANPILAAALYNASVGMCTAKCLCLLYCTVPNCVDTSCLPNVVAG
jgi:hypothetical protein